MTTSTMRDRADAYATVERAIRYIRDNARNQPSLADVAAHVELSEFHLQRVFSAWAGISPKRFLQVLTIEHAKSALKSRDVLAASLDAGLSGPGRLHDLTVAVDAMTPGEIKALGGGLEIRWGTAASPFGDVVVGRTARGVCHLELGTRDDAELREAWPRATFTRDDDDAAELVDEMFAPTKGKKPLPVLLKGTNFQVQVWRALIRIPAGSLASYGDVARSIGSPSASRAVGSAVGANSVALLIPCHRVIRDDGDVGEYRWGSARKSAVLAWEAGSAR